MHCDGIVVCQQSLIIATEPVILILIMILPLLLEDLHLGYT